MTVSNDGAGAATSKLVGIDEAARLADSHKAAGRRVVLAHGVFDLLHIGHLRHLKLARREGDVLIVSITADRFVNKDRRPVFPEQVRPRCSAPWIPYRSS